MNEPKTDYTRWKQFRGVWDEVSTEETRMNLLKTVDDYEH